MRARTVVGTIKIIDSIALTDVPEAQCRQLPPSPRLKMHLDDDENMYVPN